MKLTRPGRPILATLVAALLLAIAGCNNPFTPADPAPPSGEGVDENFSTIDALLQTMSDAIAARSTAGSNAYIHAFADTLTTGRSFRAYHDPSVKSAWLQNAAGQPAPEPWLLVNELGVYSELSRIRQNDPYLLKWDLYVGFDTEIDPANNIWSVRRHYTLFALPENAEPVPIVIGFADMLVQKSGSRFAIFEWHDRYDPQYGIVPSGGPYSMTYYRLESQ